ncbi:MAG: GTPase HflX [Deltaproteobacteria bacterium]|nr:GTPase HflX [Deltaproteobacteria bacterium]
MRSAYGNLTGLKPSQRRQLERIYRRRVPPHQIVSAELGTFLCEVSRELERQVGVLVDRRGGIDVVVVGDDHHLELPDLGRLRAGRGRFRGLRLVHTHLRGEPLTRDDLTDLAALRLDLVAAIDATADGRAALVHAAHLLPDNPDGRLWQLLPPQPLAYDALDLDALIRSLEEEFARTTDQAVARDGRPAALLVHVAVGRAAPESEARVAELRELCRTAGLQVVGVITQRRQDPDPRFLLGRGKLEEVVLRAMQLGAEMLIFDPDLSPSQARAISDETELKVIDRTMLILDIFARRARSQDGKIQVELAQLRYTLPRLVEKNTMMSRLTGGIGGRGPGETKLEINRRRARERIQRLEKQIKELGRRRALRRALRGRRRLPIISIVGYTNAGKSTLLNTLTEGDVLVEDKLFATLDPTSRRLRFPREREVILTDTVGFIRDLPEELVKAFRATLEELEDADLLIHLCDVADPDYEAHIAAVEKILTDLGLAQIPRLLCFNKADRLDPAEVAARGRRHDALCICAREAPSTRPLLAGIEERLWREDVPVPDAV